MEKSHIEWTDNTWNPWIGCTKVDELCAHCYAEARDVRFEGGIHWGKGAPRQRTSHGNWREPYRWNRVQTEARAENYERFQAELASNPKATFTDIPPPRVFCASLADWLDDEVPIEWLADMLHVVNECRNLRWLLLTKRPQNWRPRLEACIQLALQGGNFGPRDMIDRWLRGDAPEHVWIGTSVGTQKSADVRIPQLLAIPAKIRFLSCEPLLGPVEFSNVTNRSDCVSVLGKPALGGIHWVIAGGESGKGARPMHPDWARSLRNQCAAVNVPFFFKQWGGWAPATDEGSTISIPVVVPGGPQNIAWHCFDDGTTMGRVGKRAAGNLIDGREWKDFPA